VPDDRYRIISQTPPNEEGTASGMRRLEKVRMLMKKRELKKNERKLSDQCAPGCPNEFIGDGVCDEDCYNAACSDDGGDCDECAPGCPTSWINDGVCDEACLVPECGDGNDGGDCSTYYYYTPSMLERKDLGYSWGQMIRFDKLTFTTGGTFKLCFCDSALIGAVSTPCLTKKDYAIEVGKVHSSGVSCLLSQPKLQRAECETMYHGVEPKPLRCYSGIPVPELMPPLLISTQIDVSDSTEEGTYVETGSSEGAYSPEEEGMQPAPQSGNAMPPMRKRA
jgi:hypothetical protein